MIQSISSAFNRFLGSSHCSNEEKEKANEVKAIHDLIEEVAYRAFVQKVIDLNITQENITEEQSGQILSHIKAQAHKEMYKPDGYLSVRGKLLNPSQFQEVIQNVGKIVHDRDTKLTDARYYTLSELLMGLDDHNTMVKEILLRSWYKFSDFTDFDHSHLEEIKNKIDFYVQLNGHLKFDLKQTLTERKAFWDKYFPGKREASEKTSKEFVNILEVRHFFEGIERFNPRRYSDLLNGIKLDDKFAVLLKEDETKALFEPRCLRNRVRCRNVDANPLLHDRDITIREFFTYYFPDIDLNVQEHKKKKTSNNSPEFKTD